MAFYDLPTEVTSHLFYYKLFLIKAATNLSRFKERRPRSHLSMRDVSKKCGYVLKSLQ